MGGAVVVNTDRVVIPLCSYISSAVCMYGEVRRMAVDTESVYTNWCHLPARWRFS